jgi:hypothetical protein
MHDRWMARRTEFARAREAEQREAAKGGGESIEVDGCTYLIRSPLGQGESSFLLLADRADGVRERVALKMLHDRAAEARFAQSCRALAVLADHAGLARRVPRLRRQGVARRAGATCEAAVLSYESGFFQTLFDVRAQHGAAVEPAHAVWIWRRLLELLAGVHAAGLLHRALVPPHLLVHARDHGVLVVGWGASASSEAQLAALVEPFGELYPEAVLKGDAFTARDDVIMSARVVGWLLRDRDGWRPGTNTPAPLAELILEVGSGAVTADIPALDRELRSRAQRAFGPPTYVPLQMPGWKRP